MVQLWIHDTGQSGIHTFHFHWDRDILEVQQATHPTTNTPGFCIASFPLPLVFIQFMKETMFLSSCSGMDFYYRKEIEVLVLAQVFSIEKKKKQKYTNLLPEENREYLMRLCSCWSYQTFESLLCKDFSLAQFQIRSPRRLLTVMEGKEKTKQNPRVLLFSLYFPIL